MEVIDDLELPGLGQEPTKPCGDGLNARNGVTRQSGRRKRDDVLAVGGQDRQPHRVVRKDFPGDLGHAIEDFADIQHPCQRVEKPVEHLEVRSALLKRCRPTVLFRQMMVRQGERDVVRNTLPYSPGLALYTRQEPVDRVEPSQAFELIVLRLDPIEEIDDARRERFNSGKLGRGQGNGLAESEHERRGPIGGCNRRGDDVTRRTGGEHHPTASYAAASIRKDLRGWLEVRQRRLFLLGARVCIREARRHRSLRPRIVTGAR